MSFSKLLYLLETASLIIAALDHIPVFQNEKESEAGIVPFLLMLYLFRDCNQWCMYFMFLLYYFSYFCLIVKV